MSTTQTTRPEPYKDWLIDSPTTRRVRCELTGEHAFDETDCEGRRLVLIEDNRGLSYLYIAATDLEARLVADAYTDGRLPWPKSRLGSWARFVETLEWARAVFALLGWRPNADEIAIFAGFGTMLAAAPARCLPRAA